MWIEPVESCVRALRRELGPAVLSDTAALQPYGSDFGGLVHRMPAVVVRAETAAQVATTLRIAAAHAIPIATRGSGHSVSGQSLVASGVVLDLRRLADVAVDRAARTAWLGAGATWQAVADQTFPHRLFPVAPTMIADVTVGGTLSVGGVGARAFCEGVQVDRVLELEVATLRGELQRCSLQQNRELFDCMRGGLGQCGVITRARYPLRPVKQHIRSYTFAYLAHEPWLDDLLACIRDRSADWIFGGLVWSDAGWQCLLLLGREFNDARELDDAALRNALHHTSELAVRDDPLWREGGAPGHRFFRNEAGRHGSGPHPWVDHICTLETATQLLGELTSRPPIASRAGITAGVACIAKANDAAPLFVRPGGESSILVSVLPELLPDAPDHAIVLERIRAHSLRGQELGGKRYVYGLFDDWNPSDWARHYGAERWAHLLRCKQEYDPQGLLNPGCVKWR